MSMALNACIEHGFQGFRIVIQPQVETKNGRMFGGEVLLRWKNEGKEISPSKFVPILEQTGMIAPVGKWILEETMRKGKEILKYQPDFRLSVNVSYLQIMDQKFFPFLEDTMERFQIPAGALCIQYAKRQGRFSRARHPRDPHDFVQGNIYVNIFQIVYMGIPNADCPGLCPLFCFFFLYVMFVHSCLVFFFMIQFAVCSISQTRTTLLYTHYT